MALEKRYNHFDVEKGRYNIWKEKGYFKAGDKTKQKFSIVIPPPNVTGKLHIGHAIDTTIQDITCRYKKAKGFDVLYLPGCDHAGIATQAKVDQKLKEEGLDRFKIGREKFLQKAFEWKDEYSSIIHDQWAKMGLMLDYSRERFTLDEGFQEAVFKVFKTLYEEGLIYRGERIVNYDPEMRTALSNIEVVYQEDKGHFYYFKYRFKENRNKYLEIATTRPETMFGDTCIVVNPNDDKYKDVIGKTVINPANNEEIPVIADEYVDIDFGTGAMKCTPAHDPNDFIIGKKYNLAHPVIMNIDGTMCDNLGQYSNLDRFECRELLIKNLKESDDLIKIEEVIHKVGHSERSGAVVEPILSKQWFVKMKPLAEKVLNNQEKDERCEFFPQRFEKTLIQWMSNVEDWCISRQLWWGHRIPVFYNKNTNNILISRFAPDDSGDWYQDEDVLDTWFSSALWPFATMGWPNETEDFLRYYPTDTMITGYDIIFFWVSRMIFQGLHFTNKAPFKDVVIHGLVRDEQGRKMSKSLGNGVDPIEIISKYGVDSLRYFLATTSSPGQDMRFIEEKVVASSNYLNKIWNSARFIFMNLEDNFVYDENILSTDLTVIDEYILTKLQDTILNVTKAMDKYEYGIASNYLYNFVYDDFCSFYIEMSKVSLNSEDILIKRRTLTVLIKVLKDILMMIYPFSPFISEEIYLNLPIHKESIMLETYPIYNDKFAHSNLKAVDSLKQIIDRIREFKLNQKLSPNFALDLIIKNGDNLKEIEYYIKRFTFAKSLIFKNEDVENCIAYIINDSTLYINYKIDIKKELEELYKRLTFLNVEISRCLGLLNNEKFISKAPAKKIEEEKEKYSKFINEKEQIEEKIKNF